MPLSDLLAVCPPPSRPVDVPTAEQWQAASTALGVAFPDDYRSLLDTYGSGAFGEDLGDGFFDLAFTLSPGCDRYHGDLAVVPTMGEFTRSLGDMKEAYPERWQPSGMTITTKTP